ncbi:MAG: hypothetical protein Q8P20_00485 [bacterium]|nr:hypothetical protein [bacterium]
MSFYLYNENNLYNFFNSRIKLARCDEKTKTYIISIFSDINHSKNFSKESITLSYNNALEKYSFNEFKQIGDWLFFTKSIFPNSLSGASAEYYNAIASSAYYKCHILMKRQWLLFEELADRFGYLTSAVNEVMRDVQSSPVNLS